MMGRRRRLSRVRELEGKEE